MKKYIIFLLICVVALSTGGFIGSYQNNKAKTVKKINPVTTSTKSLISPVQLSNYKIYDLVNNYRAAKGLNKLIFDPSMCDFTQKRLDDIQIHFSHDGFYQGIKIAYKYTYAGENLLIGFSPEQKIIDKWINSPEHYRNIMNPNFTRTCIKSYSETKSAVQEFASW